VSALAFSADFAFAGLQRLLTPRGLKLAGLEHSPEQDPPVVLEATAVS
jgi:hypothetical protein